MWRFAFHLVVNVSFLHFAGQETLPVCGSYTGSIFYKSQGQNQKQNKGRADLAFGLEWTGERGGKAESSKKKTGPESGQTT